MKKTIMIIAAMMAAITAMAESRFYINDFSIAQSGTVEVQMILENTYELSAIQADIYLPEGLMVEMDDDEYIFDLTDRKARNHTVSSTLLSNGAIRVLISSPTSKTFSDNSGAIVTFNLTADENLAKDCVIHIKNIIASDAKGELYYIDDSNCNVHISTSAPSVTLNKRMAKLEVGETMRLSAEVDDLPVTWRSGDVNIASVDAQGEVKALYPGMVEIFAEADGVSTSCALFVFIDGDVNNDRKVDVGDVNTILTKILAK